MMSPNVRITAFFKSLLILWSFGLDLFAVGKHAPHRPRTVGLTYVGWIEAIGASSIF